MRSLHNKVVALTGAGAGIGRALALELAAQGCHLALSDINALGLEETKTLINNPQLKISTTIVDVANRESVEQWAADSAEFHGGIDIIINNAGVALIDTFEDVPYEQFHWVFNILYWGVVHCSKAFLPYIKKQGGGNIVNIGSIHSFIATANNSPYCAAKSAVRGLSDSMREELRNDNIQVTLVMPGGIKTEIVRNSKVNKFVGGETSQELVHKAHNAGAITSPELAARIIVSAIRCNRPRQLVGWDAVFYDILTRLFPNAAHRLYSWGAKLTAARLAKQA